MRPEARQDELNEPLPAASADLPSIHPSIPDPDLYQRKVALLAEALYHREDCDTAASAKLSRQPPRISGLSYFALRPPLRPARPSLAEI